MNYQIENETEWRKRLLIGIHSHILPGIDDGAVDEQASIDMARVAVEEGITHIVASPHHKNLTYENYCNEIRMKVTLLNDLFTSKNLDLTVIPGQEVRIYGDILKDLAQGEIQTINDSKYLLIEFSSDAGSHYASQIFYDMKMEGIQPIIVHPERNRELLNNPEKVYDFVRNGALTQVTTAAVVGKFGGKIATFSEQLIQANLTHLIASDAHNTTTRGFIMQETFDYIQNNINIEKAYMFMENSQLVIDNQNVYRDKPQYIKIKKKRFFDLF